MARNGGTRASYDKDSEETQLFFKTVQNIMHYAVTKQTAAEIIYDRADAERPHMGLTSWKNAPDGRVVKSDVTVAKNYLSEKEVDSLNRLSNAFIDIAEQRAEDHILMTMADWSALLQRYNMLEHFKPRLRQCMEWASPCGWGFADTIGDIYYEYFSDED